MRQFVEKSVRQFVTEPARRAFAAPAPKVVRGVLAAPALIGVALTFAGATPAFAAPGSGPGAPLSRPAATVARTRPPLAGSKLYVSSESLARQAAKKASNKAEAAILSRMADQPAAVWFGDWVTKPRQDVDRVVTAAAQQGALPVLVPYNIVNRDCGSYSAGGLATAEKYRKWIGEFAKGIEGRDAVVILEPDALAGTSCMKGAALDERLDLLKYAVKVLTENGARVYIDAGNPLWHKPAEIASRLKRAGIEEAEGFALNVSNYITTSDNIAYGTQISKLVGDKHFVIDTSRNGKGGNGEWCNPRGRALGQFPTTRTGNSLVDAFLWVKRPGESDGECNGGPHAGRFWTEYALELARNSESIALR